MAGRLSALARHACQFRHISTGMVRYSNHGRPGALARNACQFRNISTSKVRYSDHGYPGLPGENLPFNLDMGKVKMTLMFSIFFGIGTSAPWLVVMWSFIK